MGNDKGGEGETMECISCLICGGITAGRPADIAPFLIKYLGIEHSTTQVRYCRSCDFVFFQRRLTDSEAKKLYTNYRGDEYNRVRISVEPSYAPLVEYFSDPLTPYYVDRLRDYFDLMDVFPELNDSKSVLDFGGDGSVPRRLFADASIVIDDLSAGSTDTAASRFDVVFASNVFEHLSDPVSVLKQVAKRLGPEGILLIDVPKPNQASMGEGLLWQERHRAELYEMHEHISHFSKRSLGRLVAAGGLETFFEFDARHGAQTALACLPGSNISRRFLAERTTRTLLFEARMARAEARAASYVGREISLQVSAQPIAGLKGEVGQLRQQINELSSRISNCPHEARLVDIGKELERIGLELDAFQKAVVTHREGELDTLRRQIEELHASTSWRVSAPIRGVKNLLLTAKQLISPK